MQSIPSAVRTLLKGKMFAGPNAPKVTVSFVYGDPFPLDSDPSMSFTTPNGSGTDTGGIDYRPSTGTIWAAQDVASAASDILNEYDANGNPINSITLADYTLRDIGIDRDNDSVAYLTTAGSGASLVTWNLDTESKIADITVTGAALTVQSIRYVTAPAGSSYYIIYQHSGGYQMATVNKTTNAISSEGAWSGDYLRPHQIFFTGATLYVCVYDEGGADTGAVQLWDPSTWTLTETRAITVQIDAPRGITYDGANWWIRDADDSPDTVSKIESGGGTQTIQPASVHISRQKSALAQRATIKWPNVSPTDPTDAGYYSPDRGDDVPGDKNSWYQILFPGRDFTIAAGYGSNTATVFTGQVDRTDIGVRPQEYTIAVDGRDLGYRLLDKAVDDGTGVWYLSYSAQAVEDVVDDLLQKAGFAAGDITTEATGMTVTVTFQRMTYADALQKLRDLTGFDLIISETGTVSFHYPTDRQPAITNLSVTLNGTTAVNITGGASQGTAPIVSGSEVVTNTAGTVTYVKNTDYTITYGAQGTEATLARIVTGAITDGQTVHVDYVYAAWVFREGQDLFWLPYSIDRSNMYEKIVVLGQDTATDPPTVVSGTYTWGSAATYGVTGKVLFMEIPELTTGAACQAAADQAGNDMIVKLREVQFASVPVPWLQVGDSVQVIESSTTISEIYRITGIELTYSADEAIMVCTCYYYGYAPL